MKTALLIAAGWCLLMPPMLYGWYRLCIYNDRAPAPPVTVYHPKIRLVRPIPRLRGVR